MPPAASLLTEQRSSVSRLARVTPSSPGLYAAPDREDRDAVEIVATVCALVLGHAVNAASWDDTLAGARGQTCTGTPGAAIRRSTPTSSGSAIRSERHGIDLVHVKLTTAEAVARVVAEKAAGTTESGAVDLIWINGENFASMKAQDLLFGLFVEDLPNFRYVDTAGKPTTLVDFTVPTDGLEAPWGMAQFVLLYDTATMAEPPRSIPACSNGSRQPRPLHLSGAADFIGST